MKKRQAIRRKFGCGITFKRKPSAVAKRKRQFHSYECWLAYRQQEFK